MRKSHELFKSMISSHVCNDLEFKKTTYIDTSHEVFVEVFDEILLISRNFDH